MPTNEKYEIEIALPEDSKSILKTAFVMTGTSIANFIKKNPNYILGCYSNDSDYRKNTIDGQVVFIIQMTRTCRTYSPYDIQRMMWDGRNGGLVIYEEVLELNGRLKLDCLFGKQGDEVSLQSVGGKIPDILLSQCNLELSDILQSATKIKLIRNVVGLSLFHNS